MIDARIAFGSGTRDTMPWVHWRSAVADVALQGSPRLATSFAEGLDHEISKTIGNERLSRWWNDGMTVAMAADSVRTWLMITERQPRLVSLATPGIQIPNYAPLRVALQGDTDGMHDRHRDPSAAHPQRCDRRSRATRR